MQVDRGTKFGNHSSLLLLLQVVQALSYYKKLTN